jgi:hypothetical protein
MTTAKKSNSSTAKLFPNQRDIVSRYVASMRLAEGGVHIANDVFSSFKDMVLSLPNCRDLGVWDVATIAIDTGLKFTKGGSSEKALAADADPASPATEHLINFLESLPREYVVRFELPKVPFWGGYSIPIARHVDWTSQKSEEVPIRNALARLLSQGDEDNARSAVGLEFKLYGFASESLESPVVSDSLAQLKQVVYLLQYARIVKSESWDGVRARAWVLDVINQREIALQLPDRLAASLGRLVPDEEGLQTWDSQGKILLGGSYRRPRTDAEWTGALSDNAKAISNFFANSHKTGFARIGAAIEWYEDSRLNDDQTLAFLAACIGLESLLGEETSGMTELSRRLVDRYSFMLGKDRDDRGKLAQEFEEVLKVRGELVHARASRLKPKDRVQLDKVREMLWRTINHEMRPLLKDTRTTDEM